MLVQLVPFLFFSTFHAVNYFRTTFLPVLFSAPTARYYDQLLNKINAYQEWALQQVSTIEIIVVFDLLIKVFL
jgi:hypothetical protein